MRRKKNEGEKEGGTDHLTIHEERTDQEEGEVTAGMTTEEEETTTNIADEGEDIPHLIVHPPMMNILTSQVRGEYQLLILLSHDLSGMGFSGSREVTPSEMRPKLPNLKRSKKFGR